MAKKTLTYLFKAFLVAYVFMAGAAFAADNDGDKAAPVRDHGMDITVYRDASCGCCSRWIAHLKQHVFNVTDHVVHDMAAVKSRYQVPAHMSSCHTAVIDGYVIEGHVPAADIKRLLRDKPYVAGLSVPGMPVGSPGMEMAGRRDPFAVYGFTRSGDYGVYRAYPNQDAE